MNDIQEYFRLKAKIEERSKGAQEIMRDAKDRCDGDFMSDPSWLHGKRISDECQRELDDLNRRFR